MKRRNFVQSLLIVPATSIAAEEQTSPPAQTRPAPTGRPNFTGPDKLELTLPDATAGTVTGFFNPEQFAALRRLADMLVPPLKGNPGALDAHAPEFLDFLIGRSAASAQKLYRDGLDGLNSAAHKKFHKSFADLDDTQADAIVRPLFTTRFWPQDRPKDEMQHFIAQAHQDVRTATMNSPEWAASSGTNTRGRFNAGRRPYWKPIDPRMES